MTKKELFGKIENAIHHISWEQEWEEEEDEIAHKEIVFLLKLLKTMLVTRNMETPFLGLKMEYATDDVPWERKGCVGFSPKDSPEWGKSVPNTSISKHRLVDDTVLIERSFASDVYERSFAMLWDYEVNAGHGKTILDLLLEEEPIRGLIRDEVDKLIVMLSAQAVIQWLGTNCGHAFIEEARRIAEKDKERIEKEIKFIQSLTSDV